MKQNITFPNGMNVLSLFDGMSCGQLALNNLGYKINNYFASEIDKFAIKIAIKNFPNTIQLGDVCLVDGRKLPQIDLLIGGSPCQDLSISNHNGQGLNGSKSKLFYEYVRILREVKPKYFFLENVRMNTESQDIITNILGVEPIKLNSKLLSGQSRNRLYWTNIPNFSQPEDKGILLKDILQESVDPKYYFTLKCVKYLDRAKMNKRYANYLDSDKSVCITANFKKSVPYNVLVEDIKDNVVDKDFISLIGEENNKFRKLTPNECELLQTLPLNYTEGVSDTQRYAMIGNGWTIKAVEQFFKNL